MFTPIKSARLSWRYIFCIALCEHMVWLLFGIGWTFSHDFLAAIFCVMWLRLALGSHDRSLVLKLKEVNTGKEVS